MNISTIQIVECRSN